jgi:hypothetical protein
LPDVLQPASGVHLPDEHLPPQHALSTVHASLSAVHCVFEHVPLTQAYVQQSGPPWQARPAGAQPPPLPRAHTLAVGSQRLVQQSESAPQETPTALQLPPPPLPPLPSGPSVLPPHAPKTTAPNTRMPNRNVVALMGLSPQASTIARRAQRAIDMSSTAGTCIDCDVRARWLASRVTTRLSKRSSISKGTAVRVSI